MPLFKLKYLSKVNNFRFRHCQSSIPIRNSVMHAVVRGFLENGEIDRLIEIIKDKVSTCIGFTKY